MQNSLLDNKRFFFNALNRIGFVALGKIMAFVSIPLISRALGPENFGLYNFVITLASYGFLLANWGFLAKGIRDTARRPQDSGKIIAIITSSRLILWLIGSVIILSGCLLIYGLSSLIFLLSIGIFANLGMALMIDYHFYALKNTFLPSITHLLGQVLFFVLIILFINDPQDLVLILYFNVLYRLIEAITLILVFKRTDDFKLSFSLGKTKALFFDNFSLGLGSKISFFQNSFPILLIPYLTSQYELGIFSAAFKFYLILTILFQTLNLVISPWIVEARSKSIQVQKRLFIQIIIIYFGIGMLAWFFFFFFGDYFVQLLFGDEYQDSKLILKFFTLFLIPIWPIYSCLASYMNNLEKDRNFLYGGILAVIVILSIMPVGILWYGLKGVVIALSISTTTICIYYLSVIRKLFFKPN